MATLKEFEDALREQGMHMALALLQKLRERDKAQRSVAPARRVVGKKMTTDLAHRILDLHASTNMTQQEIAFQLGVNQGRVNEVIKHRKWLSGKEDAPEEIAKNAALARMVGKREERVPPGKARAKRDAAPVRTARTSKKPSAQLSFGDL